MLWSGCQQTERPLPARLRGKLTLSVDVEDWHQLVRRRWTGRTDPCSAHVESQMSRVLDALERYDVRGTFFVLGAVAAERPELVRKIAARGHEIASHGMSHTPLDRLERAALRAELRESRDLLQQVTGADVVGFRAPEFSIRKEHGFVLEELAQAGYRYDSSIFPIVHRRYGVRDFPRTPVRLRFESGSSLWELPLATLSSRFGNLPIAGGGYFRLLPGVAIDRALRSVAGHGDLAMLYLHPYEFARDELRVDDTMLPSAFVPRLKAEVWFALQAVRRASLPGKVTRLLAKSRFSRAIDIVEALELETSAEPARADRST